MKIFNVGWRLGFGYRDKKFHCISSLQRHNSMFKAGAKYIKKKTTQLGAFFIHFVWMCILYTLFYLYTLYVPLMLGEDLFLRESKTFRNSSNLKDLSTKGMLISGSAGNP